MTLGADDLIERHHSLLRANGNLKQRAERAEKRVQRLETALMMIRDGYSLNPQWPAEIAGEVLKEDV